MAKPKTADKGTDQTTTVATHAGIFTIHSAGAQISQWDSSKFGPLIFSPRKAVYQVGHSPHGGIPICFPWFGTPTPLPDDDVSPLGGQRGAYPHGFARLLNWTKIADDRTESTWKVVFRLTNKDVPKKVGKTQPFRADYTAIFSKDSLRLKLEVENTGPAPFCYESAFHTYFRVDDIRNVEVCGLEGATYVDTALPDQPTRVQDGPITFGGLVDRVYDTILTPKIIDPSIGRAISVESENSGTTIVWNPGPEGATDLADLAKSEWKRFVCVETGNARDNSVTLLPRHSHAIEATYRVGRV